MFAMLALGGDLAALSAMVYGHRRGFERAESAFTGMIFPP